MNVIRRSYIKIMPPHPTLNYLQVQETCQSSVTSVLALNYLPWSLPFIYPMYPLQFQGSGLGLRKESKWTLLNVLILKLWSPQPHFELPRCVKRPITCSHKKRKKRTLLNVLIKCWKNLLFVTTAPECLGQ